MSCCSSSSEVMNPGRTLRKARDGAPRLHLRRQSRSLACATKVYDLRKLLRLASHRADSLFRFSPLFLFSRAECTEQLCPASGAPWHEVDTSLAASVADLCRERGRAAVGSRSRDLDDSFGSSRSAQRQHIFAPSLPIPFFGLPLVSDVNGRGRFSFQLKKKSRAALQPLLFRSLRVLLAMEVQSADVADAGRAVRRRAASAVLDCTLVRRATRRVRRHALAQHRCAVACSKATPVVDKPVRRVSRGQPNS